MVVMTAFKNVIVANSGNQYKKINLKNNNRLSKLAFSASIRKHPAAAKRLAKPEYINFNKGVKLFEKYAKKFYYEMAEILIDVPYVDDVRNTRSFWDIMLTSLDVNGKNRKILWHVDKYRDPSDICEDLKDTVKNTWSDLIKYNEYDD